MVKPQGPDNENREERKEKFDVTLEDVSPENSGGLNIRLEDLPPEVSAHSATGNPSQAGLGRPVQLVYCQQCGRGSQVGFRYCPNCATALVSQGGARTGQRLGWTSRKRILIVAIVFLSVIFIATAFLYAFGVISFSSNARTNSVTVPGDYSTIQEALNQVEDGWEIIVKPGIYYENINFLGKVVMLRSDDPDNPEVVKATIIDGGRQGPVVVFNNGETAEAALSGFTIRNGSGLRDIVIYESDSPEDLIGFFGGGILVSNASSPRIENNVIENNLADFGGGVAVYNASPTIEKNSINGNRAIGFGGGLLMVNAAGTAFNNNEVQSNKAEKGGAVWGDNPEQLEVLRNSPNTFNNNIPDDLNP